MKFTIFIAVIAGLLSVCPISRCELTIPPGPSVSHESAGQLCEFIRRNIDQYLDYRTPVDEKKFSLKSIGPAPKSPVDLPVCITFRRNGIAVACGFSRGRGLVGNAISASLQAVRSPELGDKVTRELMCSLMLEIEIMGPETQVARSVAVDSIIPGLTGLDLQVGVFDPSAQSTSLARAYQEVFVSPAEQYRRGLTPQQSVEDILRNFEDRPIARGLKSTWNVYRTLHFVDYPDAKQPDFLYRGKIFQLYPGDMAFLVKMLNAIIASQQPAGEIVAPDGRGGALWESAYLVFAVKKAAAAVKPGKNENLAKIKQAMSNFADSLLAMFAKQYIGMGEDKKLRWAVCDADKPLRTVAFLLLATQYDTHEPSAEFRKALEARIVELVYKDGKINRDELTDPLDQAVAVNALLAGTRDDDKIICILLDDLLSQAGFLGSKPADAGEIGIAELAWTARAILSADNSIRQQYVPYLKKILAKLILAQKKYTKVIDLTGGLTEPDGRTTVDGTAAAAASFCEMAGLADWPQGWQAIGLALEYCWMSTYRPGEAYFVADPDSWQGWVRVEPQAAKVSIHSTAAAIDALGEKLKTHN